MATRRLSVTTLVCPHAPFLVPQACRPFLLKLQSAGLLNPIRPGPGERGYATQSDGNSKFLNKVKSNRDAIRRGDRFRAGKNPRQKEMTLLYHEHITKGSLTDVMQMYPHMVLANAMRPIDTIHTVKLLHYHLREQVKNFEIPQLADFAEAIVRDLQTKRIPPHPSASVQLMSFYKDADLFEEGRELWNWLLKQGPDYTDAGVVGAAIEFFAKEGKMKLHELEEMYQSALRRFEHPGSYAEYHLSPDAILSDRKEMVRTGQLPVTLLQGITTARLLYGDWRKAYMGLDVALRLFPTQVPLRMFDLFQEYRPIPEAYAVFSVACRTGTVARPETLTKLLNRMAMALKRNSVGHQIMLLQGMVTAIKAYVGAGGTLSSFHVGVCVKAFDLLLVERNPAAMASKSSNRLSRSKELVVILAEQLMSLFYFAGIPPSPRMMGNLMSLAGKTGHKDMFLTNINMLKQESTGMDAIHHRIAVFAAGQLGEKDIFEERWIDLVNFANTSGKQISVQDWQVFAHAAWLADHAGFVEQQMQMLGHTLTEETERLVHSYLARPHKATPDPLANIDTTVLEFHLNKLKDDFGHVTELVKVNSSLLNFNDNPTPVQLGPPLALGTESTLRSAYDSLTTDPNQPAPPPSAGGVMLSTTSLPLDKLRFENWKTINDILLMAEGFEARKKETQAQFLATGGHFETSLFDMDLTAYYAESDLQATMADEASGREVEVPVLIENGEELLRRILMLRGSSRLAE